MPVYGTMAATFADPGTNRLYRAVAQALDAHRPGHFVSTLRCRPASRETTHVIPGDRVRYLAEIVESNRRYNRWAASRATSPNAATCSRPPLQALPATARRPRDAAAGADRAPSKLAPECRRTAATAGTNCVRALRRALRVPGARPRGEGAEPHALAVGPAIPKVALPRFRSHGERLRWLLTENVPGRFPFAAGVYPFKRTAEDPTRMFAGEGGPERTNRRFHYLSFGQPYKRLSTAFDSVTLYGEDPAQRPDMFGKVGNAGVSICTLDDAKRLYSGFDLCDPVTSVSMTINGPAPMLLAFFLNAAIDQQCERWLVQNGKVAAAERHDRRAVPRARPEPRPRYRSELPPATTASARMLLGVTGDQVVPPEVYAKIRRRRCPWCAAPCRPTS
jgi:methylmalonyl-CoA mutase